MHTVTFCNGTRANACLGAEVLSAIAEHLPLCDPASEALRDAAAASWSRPRSALFRVPSKTRRSKRVSRAYPVDYILHFWKSDARSHGSHAMLDLFVLLLLETRKASGSAFRSVCRVARESNINWDDVVMAVGWVEAVARFLPDLVQVPLT